MSDNWSIRQPSSATIFQGALAHVDAPRLVGLDPERLTLLWDPWTCPEALLPYLAWALSVDVWDPTWPLDVQRRAIATAPQVHRLKGTRAAVEQALSTLNITAELVEWWQASPPARRGTFKITAWARRPLDGDAVILSERLQRQAQAFVTAAKPKSRVYEFELGAGFDSTLGVADSACRIVARSDVIEAAPRTDLSGELGVADAASTIAATARTVSAQPNLDQSLELGLAARACAVASIRQSLIMQV